MDMDRMNVHGYDIFLLFVVHHQRYYIMMLFIELSKDGQGFAVGPGVRYLLPLYYELCFLRQCIYLSPLCVVKRDIVSIDTLLFRGFWGSAVASHLVVNDCNAMPPHRGTPWASHGFILSPSVSPQPIRSDNGKGKAKEPPPRSAAVRKLDELLDAPRPSSASNKAKLVRPRRCRVLVPLPIMRDVSASVRPQHRSSHHPHERRS